MDVLVPESDIRIDADGVWFYRGTEMIRREIIDLFYQHLRQDESGHYVIEIGQQRYPVDVEDTAFTNVRNDVRAIRGQLFIIEQRSDVLQ
jgi:hypothetical protein